MRIKPFLILFLILILAFLYEGFSVIKSVTFKENGIESVYKKPEAVKVKELMIDSVCGVKSNPFVHPKIYTEAEKIVEMPPFDYVLSAIISKDNIYTAMVKGANEISLIVQKGDMLGKWKVEEITKDRMTVSYNGIEKSISIW